MNSKKIWPQKFLKFSGANDVIVLVASDLLNRVLIQIFVSILARKVDLEILAHLTLAQGIASFSLQYSEGSLNPIALKRVESRYIKNSFREIIQLKLLITFTFIAFVIVVFCLSGNDLMWYFVFASLTPILTCYNLQFVQQMNREISRIALSRVAVGIATSVSGIIVLQLDLDSNFFLYLIPYAIGTLWSVLLSMDIRNLKDVLKSSAGIRFKNLKNLFIRSYKFGLLALSLQIFQFVPLMFTSTFSQHSLDALGLSTRVWYILAIPISMFSVVLLPRMMNGEVFLRNWIILVNLIYMGVFILSTFLGKIVLGVLYGSQSLDFTLQVYWFCSAMPLWASSNLILNFMISKNGVKGLLVGPIVSTSLLCTLLSFLRRETDLYIAWFVANLLLLIILIYKRSVLSKSTLIQGSNFLNQMLDRKIK